MYFRFCTHRSIKKKKNKKNATHRAVCMAYYMRYNNKLLMYNIAHLLYRTDRVQSKGACAKFAKCFAFQLNNVIRVRV